MGIELDPHELLEVFGEHDPTEHADEARERWGDTDAYRQSQQRTRRYGKRDWLRLRDAQEDLEVRLAAAFIGGTAPDSDDAAALAEEHRQGMTAFYDCSYDMHRGLGRLYVEDERFTAHYDRRAPGLASWLCAAIEANAARHGA